MTQLQFDDSSTCEIQSLPKLLCIDDDPNFAYWVKRCLRPFAIHCAVAFNGKQGYWTAVTTKPDVILTDVHMPSGNGRDLIGWLRHNSVLRGVPLIAISGLLHTDLTAQLERTGADLVLEKPISRERLHEVLGSYIPLNPRQSASPRSGSGNQFFKRGLRQ